MNNLKIYIKNRYFFLFLFSFVFFILGNWFFSLTSPDEGKNAFPVLHMLQTKNFLIPYYNCQPRFEKPPMLYWLGVVTSSIFGLNEFSLRIISGISATGILFFTYLIAKKYFSEKKALISALILVTIPHIWVEARAFTPEMLLNFFSVGAVYLFLSEKIIWGWIFLALAVLTKGPVGFILPLIVVLGFKICEKDLKLSKLFNIKGILLFLLISTSWYLYMLIYFGYAYFYKFFLYENIYRYFGQKSIHSYPFYYYFIVLLLATFFYIPTYVKLVFKIKQNLNNFINNYSKILLHPLFPFVFWFVFVFIFYTLAKNKLHHYILFCYPPLAVILANYLSEKYFKTVLIFSCFLLIFSLISFCSYEKKRFVYKVKPFIINPSRSIKFYNTEISCLTFYAKRCIFKYKDKEPMPDLIITKKKFEKNFSNCKKLIEASEFGRSYILLQCR